MAGRSRPRRVIIRFYPMRGSAVLVPGSDPLAWVPRFRGSRGSMTLKLIGTVTALQHSLSLGIAASYRLY
eukprot:scaffold68231_cov46-Phaeocystis_antarctica.AAC.3